METHGQEGEQAMDPSKMRFPSRGQAEWAQLRQHLPVNEETVLETAPSCFLIKLGCLPHPAGEKQGERTEHMSILPELVSQVLPGCTAHTQGHRGHL